MFPDPVDSLDAAATLARAADVVRRRRAVEVEDLRLVGHWADLHGEQPPPSAGAGVPGGDRLVRLGGEGTPMVRELTVAELAVARGVHPVAGEHVVADVLDLTHRLPRTWAVVEALAGEVWVARRVAGMTRGLSSAAVAVVDAAVAGCLASESPSRVLTIAQAKVVEADPDGHAARVAEQRRRRYVSLSRTDEHGLRHVIARVTAGDAVWIDAMVDHVADLLAPGHDPDATRQELRSEAFGWLARPAELLALLLEARHAARDAGQPHPADADPPDPTGEETREPGPLDPDPDPEPEPEPGWASRAVAFPADLLAALRSVDPARLRPRVILYVHLHQAAVTGTLTGHQSGTGAGVARVEGIGPMLPGQLLDFLPAAQVTVTPVVDLADRVSVNAYETPQAIRERVLLACPGEYFPHATTISRRVDLDHPTPYQPAGPPGQTGTHNSGPLTRRRHRIKTYAGYQARQIGPAEYLWRTPHGDYRLVDHTGTHHFPTDFGDQIFTGHPAA